MAKKENTTKSFVLRVDAATMEAIEKWAADEFRSTNGQLQWIINEALRKSGRLKKTKKTGHYKIFCVNGNTGFRNESRIFYFIHLQNEEDYERKESSSA